MNASPADQRRLVEIAELDARIRQADHARKHPPQTARVQELLARRQELSRELSVRQGARDDLRIELSRIESDVAVVDARAARDAQRLTSSTNSKEAQGLESELASLARRKSDLEDAELEVMERLEQADAAVAEQEALIAETNAEGGRLSAEGKQAVADSTTTFEQASRDRAAVPRASPPTSWRSTRRSPSAVRGQDFSAATRAKRATWCWPEPISRRSARHPTKRC